MAMKLLKEVMQEIKPDKKRVKKEVNDFLGKLNSGLKKAKVNAKAVAGGSIAKGTFLKGDHDCDIFVKFNYRQYKSEDISSILGSVLRATFSRVKVLHGSRDYFQIKNSIKYEIVPVLNIRKPENAKNITDCSPLHVKWVNRFPLMKKDIMLTKAFCKAAGVYGAESYIKGFSGHVVDIITIYYGGFMNLLKASKKWRPKVVIDYYDYHKGKALFNLNKSKTQSPLIVIDPVQPDRNAAAALGYEKFSIFKKKASGFLKNPSKRFFISEKTKVEHLQKKAKSKKGKLILIDAVPLIGKEDVVGAKLLKIEEYIVKQLKLNDFVVIDHGWDWDKGNKALFWIIITRADLPRKSVREGPPVKSKGHYERFKRAHKNTFEKKGRIYAEVERKYVNAERFIKNMLKDSYIKEKVRNIRLRG